MQLIGAAGRCSPFQLPVAVLATPRSPWSLGIVAPARRRGTERSAFGGVLRAGADRFLCKSQ